MKKITFAILSVMIISCTCKGQEMKISFNASDTALESAFNQAKQMALHYSRNAGVPGFAFVFRYLKMERRQQRGGDIR